MVEDEVNQEMKTKTRNPLTNPQSNAIIVKGMVILHMSEEMQRSHVKIEPMWRKLSRQRQQLTKFFQHGGRNVLLSYVGSGRGKRFSSPWI